MGLPQLPTGMVHIGAHALPAVSYPWAFLSKCAPRHHPLTHDRQARDRRARDTSERGKGSASRWSACSVACPSNVGPPVSRPMRALPPDRALQHAGSAALPEDRQPAGIGACQAQLPELQLQVTHPPDPRRRQHHRCRPTVRCCVRYRWGACGRGRSGVLSRRHDHTHSARRVPTCVMQLSFRIRPCRVSLRSLHSAQVGLIHAAAFTGPGLRKQHTTGP